LGFGIHDLLQAAQLPELRQGFESGFHLLQPDVEDLDGERVDRREREAAREPAQLPVVLSRHAGRHEAAPIVVSHRPTGT